jgi:hypothetical protein
VEWGSTVILLCARLPPIRMYRRVPLGKGGHDPTAQNPPLKKISFQKPDAHLCRHAQIRRPGNGDFDDTPPALHPPFYGAVGRGSGSRFIAALFRAFFIGRFVTGWAGDSNRPAADAPVELILLRLGVWRAVDAVAVLIDFHDHGFLLMSFHLTFAATIAQTSRAIFAFSAYPCVF